MASMSITIGIVVLAARLAAGATTSCATPDAPPAPRPLRFVTFNVDHGGLGSEILGDDSDLEDRFTLATGELERLDADVIGLQEASQGWRRGDVARRFAKALGFQYAFEGATQRLFGGGILGFLSATVLGFDEGPAVVSRWPITATHVWDVDHCDIFYRRVLVCADVCTPWGPLRACSTHLSGSECQAASVDAHLRKNAADMPVVLMGDLNATEDSPALSLLRGRGGFVDTFRAANPGLAGYTDDQELDAEHATAFERVDYVLVSAAAPLGERVLSSRVVLDRPTFDEDGDVLWSSDHYAVLSEVDVFGRTVTDPASRASREPRTPRAASSTPTG
jgi:endonuclease/exonuclease/phosphatase family metal-dependent hydrolase